MNNHYSHIITEDLNIITNENLWLFISKDPNYQKQKQTNFKDAYEIIQTGIGKVTEKISNDKKIRNKQSIFRMESHVMLSGKENIHTLKNKLTCRLEKYNFIEWNYMKLKAL